MSNGNSVAVVTAREGNALTSREEHGRELATAHSSALAQHEIQSAIIVAQKCPRNEDNCFGSLMKSAKRPSFAFKARYQYPRGGQTITGPSVHLAREAARLWGNVRYGFDIVRDDGESIHLRGWAWDMETNTKVSQDAHFARMVQRKNKQSGKTEYVKPDERDLRELVNKHGAIAERNCLLKLLPPDLIEDTMVECRRTTESGIKEDIDQHRKQVISAFAGLNIAPTEIEEYLGNALKHATPAQIADLREIYKSISDGNSRWTDYVSKPKPEEKPLAAKVDVTAGALLGESDEEALAREAAALEAKEAAEYEKSRGKKKRDSLLPEEPELSGSRTYPE